MAGVDAREMRQTRMITADSDIRGEYSISRIPNQRLGIGETQKHAIQARQHSVWRHLRRPECAGFRL